MHVVDPRSDPAFDDLRVLGGLRGEQLPDESVHVARGDVHVRIAVRAVELHVPDGMTSQLTPDDPSRAVRVRATPRDAAVHPSQAAQCRKLERYRKGVCHGDVCPTKR
jgi:hypothetical protein